MVAVNPLAQKSLELLVLLEHGLAESSERLRALSHLLDRSGEGFLDPLTRAADQVDGDIVDHAPDRLMYQLALLERRVVLADGDVFALEQAHVGEAGYVDETCPQPVV